MSEANKTLIRQLIEETVNQGNFARIDQALSKDYVYREPTVGERRGPEGYRQLVTMYRTAFPDCHMTIDEQIAEGDRVVTRWTARGTQHGELFGIAPTGNPITVQGVVLSRFASGKLVEEFEVFDTLGLLRQLGAVPATLAKAA